MKMFAQSERVARVRIEGVETNLPFLQALLDPGVARTGPTRGSSNAGSRPYGAAARAP